MGFLNLFRRSGPKIKVQSTKKDSFSGWLKCSGCNELIHADEISENQNCCLKCGFHYRLTVTQRINLLSDSDTFQEYFTHFKTADPLKFDDQVSYPERVEKAKAKAGRDEAACVGLCEVEGQRVALGVLDFSFMGGSMGSVVGERLTSLIELAIDENLPVVIVSCSGGARMQESIHSLMQMAKTSCALARLHEKGLPYISILTNPTTGGVTASFASLGDIIIAEPNALIGFAGPRVVEQTIGQKLPEGAQRSEFLQEKGMVDLVVHRAELKKNLSFFINFLMHNNVSRVKFSQSKKREGIDVTRRIRNFLSAAVGSK